MLKRDPYDNYSKWVKWKQANYKAIGDISRHNSDLILSFLKDMEIGKNVSPVAKKGERSCSRLIGLKSRLLFFATIFKGKYLDKITKDEIHQLFFDMRSGKIVKNNDIPYRAVGNFVRDFKVFWRWLMRTGKVKEDITIDLSRQVKPQVVSAIESQA